MGDRATFKKRDGTTVASNVPCSRYPSKITPQEIGLGDRTTAVSLWDVTIPVGTAFLTDPAYKDILSTLRAFVTDGRSGVVTINHVIEYMGPHTNQTSALFVCQDVG